MTESIYEHKQRLAGKYIGHINMRHQKWNRNIIHSPWAFIFILYKTHTHVATSESRLELWPASSNCKSNTFFKHWTYDQLLCKPTCTIKAQKKTLLQLLAQRALIINNSTNIAKHCTFVNIPHMHTQLQW